jgi:hypothetical protein
MQDPSPQRARDETPADGLSFLDGLNRTEFAQQQRQAQADRDRRQRRKSWDTVWSVVAVAVGAAVGVSVEGMVFGAAGRPVAQDAVAALVAGLFGGFAVFALVIARYGRTVAGATFDGNWKEPAGLLRLPDPRRVASVLAPVGAAAAATYAAVLHAPPVETREYVATVSCEAAFLILVLLLRRTDKKKQPAGTGQVGQGATLPE